MPSLVVSIIMTPRLTIESSWQTVHSILYARRRGNWEGRSHYNMAFKAIDQSNCFNYGPSHYNMAFYCQWPIKSLTEISVSLAFASNFFVNNSSRRLSRCPRTISLDDRDYKFGWNWSNVLEKKMKIWKVYDNKDNNNHGQWHHFDQKSTIEPSAQVS